MTIAHNLVFSADAATRGAIAEWMAGGPLDVINDLPGARRVDTYVPSSQAPADRYVDDGAGPSLTVQTCFDDVQALETALATPAFLDTFNTNILTAGSLTHHAFEMRFYPVAGETEPSPWIATTSYVVRYYGPAPDEQAFVDYYIAHHAPLLGKFAGIRNVMCYLPIDWQDPTNIASAGYLFGNEVVFDSVAALNASLESPLRDELREDYHLFPPIDGHNTHFAMHRTQVK